jgi:hypothetical protein
MPRGGLCGLGMKLKHFQLDGKLSGRCLCATVILYKPPHMRQFLLLLRQFLLILLQFLRQFLLLLRQFMLLFQYKPVTQCNMGIMLMTTVIVTKIVVATMGVICQVTW